MITAPADFIAVETRRTLPAIFDLFNSPFYFPTGLDGSGTLVDCTFVSPGRIQVDYGAASASWVSEVMTNPAEIMPAAATPSWSQNLPGYSIAVEWRTSSNINKLTTLSWQTLTIAEISLNRYYQFRVVWTAIRAWFLETLPPGSDTFYFVETLPDAQASYFCEGTGIISYFENFSLVGEYQFNPEDIADPGSYNGSAGEGFGSLMAGEWTFELINRNNKFTPGHANFIFKEENWYRKSLRVSLRYEPPRTAAIENFFEGVITKWGPRPEGLESPEGPVVESRLEVTAQSLIMNLLETRVGVPDDDGTLRPWVCGEVLREMTQLADESITPPEKIVDGETGDISQFSTTLLSGSGSLLEADSVYKVTGDYSIKATVAAANAQAAGRLDLAMPRNKVLLSAWLMIPALVNPNNHLNSSFMGLLGAAWTFRISLSIGADYKVYLWVNGVYQETSWRLNQDVGAFKRVSIGLVAAADGCLKVWVNGDEVFSDEGDYSAIGAVGGGWVGITNGQFAENWVAYFDNIQISPDFEKFAYRLPGYPYQEIKTVYQDGAVRRELKKQWIPESISFGRAGVEKMVSIFTAGQAVETSLIIKHPDLGVVIFHDPDNPPQGTIYARARKNDTTHPVDAVQEALLLAGRSDLVDAATFAAAKAMIPEDSIGCWFEDVTLGDIIKRIGEVCLIDFVDSGGKLKPVPYLGTAAAASSVATIVWKQQFEQSIEMANIISRVRGTYGWHDRNSLLFHKAVDLGALQILAPVAWAAYQQGTLSLAELEKLGKDLELDFSFGQEVSSDNGAMVKQKVEWALNRYRRAWETVSQVIVPFTYARIEELDAVKLESPSLALGFYYWVQAKSLSAKDRTVTFDLVKYLGEAQPA